MSGTDVAILLAAHAELARATRAEELLARAAELAPAACGFHRGLVASVRDGWLTTAGSRPLADPASDALRRLLMARPLALTPGSEEGEHIRHLRRPRSLRRPTALPAALGLGDYALAVVAPESSALALVVLDRASGPPTREDLVRVDAFAGLVGIALEQVLLRRRIADLAGEVRQFAGTARALAGEALDAPPTLAADHVPDSALLPGHAAGVGDATDFYARLSDKEQPVARLLAEGRSNREIAAAETVSPETVKSHVASILRKLGVANRVEAATLLLRSQ